MIQPHFAGHNGQQVHLAVSTSELRANESRACGMA